MGGFIVIFKMLCFTQLSLCSFTKVVHIKCMHYLYWDNVLVTFLKINICLLTVDETAGSLILCFLSFHHIHLAKPYFENIRHAGYNCNLTLGALS